MLHQLTIIDARQDLFKHIQHLPQQWSFTLPENGGQVAQIATCSLFLTHVFLLIRSHLAKTFSCTSSERGRRWNVTGSTTYQLVISHIHPRLGISTGGQYGTCGRCIGWGLSGEAQRCDEANIFVRHDGFEQVGAKYALPYLPALAIESAVDRVQIILKFTQHLTSYFFGVAYQPL